MKTALLITHANQDPKEEVVIGRFQAHSGKMTYLHEGMYVTCDFDEHRIDVLPTNTPHLYAWEATEDDLINHDGDFGLYVQGGDVE